MKPDAPIGIFDSGVGGLSVWREIVRALPGEATLYLADQARFPYGVRPRSEIRRFAEEITRFLLAQGAKLIVVACNTASGAALGYLRETFPHVPIVGMEPAVKPAVERSRSGVVGVIATPATLRSERFHRLVERFAARTTLHVRACPRLVEAVEAGELEGAQTFALLHRCLDPMLAAGIDQLVLGCTHFPFLRPAIQQVVGDGVELVDPAPAVARRVRYLLAEGGGLSSASSGEHRLYTTGDPAELAAMARSLIGYEGPVLHAALGP